MPAGSAATDCHDPSSRGKAASSRFSAPGVGAVAAGEVGRQRQRDHDDEEATRSEFQIGPLPAGHRAGGFIGAAVGRLVREAIRTGSR